MLEILGLDQEAERLYRLMLAHPHDGVVELSQRFAAPPAQIRRLLDRLSGLALVHPAAQEGEFPGTGFRPVPPEVAMELLLARQQADLAAQQLKIEASRAAAARLIAECSALRPQEAASHGEQLTGPEEIRSRLSRLADETMHEIMTFAPGGAHTEADLEASREPNAALLDRGIVIRTVYLDSVRNHQPTARHLQWLSDHGGHVRTVPTLPIRMIISDRRLAVLPIDTADARAGAVLLQGSGTVTALCALFESFWSNASPLSSPRASDSNGLPAQEAAVLRLLAHGLTDEAIAKRLGVSPRTARRIAADLMERLEARSRFEAGVHAVQDGWLPSTR
ncbi:helix-turn-helix transcriptional regulator [Kitasatospora sp. NPDC085879]|uniref:helix-turn-helix transcriptional regulator n=1 Tax=Kitasatospora sp. NPDC085879 TaxID=3154769 RepID=UPI00344474F5